MAVHDGGRREGEDTYFYLYTHKIGWKGKMKPQTRRNSPVYIDIHFHSAQCHRVMKPNAES
jgi:hypothetical protein